MHGEGWGCGGRGIAAPREQRAKRSLERRIQRSRPIQQRLKVCEWLHKQPSQAAIPLESADYLFKGWERILLRPLEGATCLREGFCGTGGVDAGDDFLGRRYFALGCENLNQDAQEHGALADAAAFPQVGEHPVDDADHGRHKVWFAEIWDG